MRCIRSTPPDCWADPGCVREDGCVPGMCPDFIIKRHDTEPAFKVSVADEDGNPMNLEGLVLEASMWARARLKSDILPTDTSLRLADNIGFNQALVGDTIIFDRIRNPEHMLVTGFDEDKKTIQVERGVHNTTPSCWKRGTGFRIFRFMSASASTEMEYEDIQQVDGNTLCDQLIESFLVYRWRDNDTCVPGCFYLEFKLLSLNSDNIYVPSATSACSCFAGIGVTWVRRFPVCGDGFLIKICQSPTSELC